ncbi:hypothetical protein CEXT_427231 [Caerostris extrusa]|uniref:Uncharacterized protein n=1 Tax=Caerostris extrusa TaxID=172846 RepID=A0AAV4R8G9_CAEEX|nr:hypothetical protein CEXT_427231 [Caerostris extrusa]
MDMEFTNSSRLDVGSNSPNPKLSIKRRSPINDELISSTFDLLNKGEKEIMFKEEFKDVILVLGNTGSGKSFLRNGLQETTLN